jgi:hypothetical protein
VRGRLAGHLGPDILGMILLVAAVKSKRFFCPCLRTRVAAACILRTRLAVRAGLGGAVGSVFALTESDFCDLITSVELVPLLRLDGVRSEEDVLFVR